MHNDEVVLDQIQKIPTTILDHRKEKGTLGGMVVELGPLMYPSYHSYLRIANTFDTDLFEPIVP